MPVRVCCTLRDDSRHVSGKPKGPPFVRHRADKRKKPRKVIREFVIKIRRIKVNKPYRFTHF